MSGQYNYEKSKVCCLSTGIEIEPIREDRNDDQVLIFIPYKQIRSVKYIKRQQGCCNQTLCILVDDVWNNIDIDTCNVCELYNTIKENL
jgi:hypothetical protein